MDLESVWSSATAPALVEAVTTTWPESLRVLDECAGDLIRQPRAAARHMVAALSDVADDFLGSEALTVEVQPRRLRELAIMRGSEAGFGGWGATFGFGPGVLAATVAALREMVHDTPAVVAPTGVSTLVEEVDPVVFAAAVNDCLRGISDPLDRVQRGLGLSDTGLACLFGVSRQAVDQWKGRGVPPSRREALAHMVATVDLLERKLRPGQLPLMAATVVDGLGGRTLLEAMAADPRGTRTLYEEAFDYGASA